VNKDNDSVNEMHLALLSYQGSFRF